MGRILLVSTVALLAVGGWYASTNYSLEVHRTAEGSFQYVRIVPRAAKTETTPIDTSLDQPPAAPLRPTIRVASFNLDGLDDARLANPKVCDVLVRILARFDVIAIQNVHWVNRGVLMRLKDQINATGRSYDFVSRPVLDEVKAPDTDETHNAILFDATTVEVDHATLHCVNPPPGMFRACPLVAEFRVRGPAAKEAFTFTLVNVLVDPPGSPQSLDLLANLFRAERDNGRGEDDIIMVGDLEADPENFGPLADVPGMTAAINGAADHDARDAAVRQHPLRSPCHGRVHRSLWRAGHGARAGPHAARGPGDFLALARLGRVQLVRERPGEPRELTYAWQSTGKS